MLFGFAFAEAPQPGTTETLLASELYPDVEPGTIDTTGSFNELVAINVKKTLENTYISEEQILKYIQEAPLPSNFELSINHSVVIKVNHTKFEIERSSFVIEASELEDLVLDLEKEVVELLSEREEQIATLQKKCSDLEAESAKNAEKVVELTDEKNKLTQDLTQQVASERQKFQAQIASLREENNLLKEKLKEAKENEDALKVEIENLKAEISEKSILQIRVKETLEDLIRELEPRFIASEQRTRAEFSSDEKQ